MSFYRQKFEIWAVKSFWKLKYGPSSFYLWKFVHNFRSSLTPRVKVLSIKREKHNAWKAIEWLYKAVIVQSTLTQQPKTCSATSKSWNYVYFSAYMLLYCSLLLYIGYLRPATLYIITISLLLWPGATACLDYTMHHNRCYLRGILCDNHTCSTTVI